MVILIALFLLLAVLFIASSFTFLILQSYNFALLITIFFDLVYCFCFFYFSFSVYYFYLLFILFAHSDHLLIIIVIQLDECKFGITFFLQFMQIDSNDDLIMDKDCVHHDSTKVCLHNIMLHTITNIIPITPPPV